MAAPPARAPRHVLVPAHASAHTASRQDVPGQPMQGGTQRPARRALQIEQRAGLSWKIPLAAGKALTLAAAAHPRQSRQPHLIIDRDPGRAPAIVQPGMATARNSPLQPALVHTRRARSHRAPGQTSRRTPTSCASKGKRTIGISQSLAPALPRMSMPHQIAGRSGRGYRPRPSRLDEEVVHMKPRSGEQAHPMAAAPFIKEAMPRRKSQAVVATERCGQAGGCRCT